MNAPAHIETPVAQFGETTDVMASDFDRLIQNSVNQLMFNDSKMDRMLKTAEIMASGKTTIPAHLRGSIGDCMAIVLQAAQWNMNPFSVAQKTHLVNGTLGYEAQLVNAVVITRAPIVGRPQFVWEGDWAGVNGKTEKRDALAVTISATFIGSSEPTLHRVSMAQAGVRNSPLWEHDPRMQLAYLAIKRWARLYCPDVLLGVYSADELEAPVPLPVISEPVAPPTTRTEALKQRMRPIDVTPDNAQSVHALYQVLTEQEVVDTATGEVLPAPAPTPEDPIADLILAISECQTREELERHRATVAGLKNGMKKRAVEAWKAVEATFPKAA